MLTEKIGYQQTIQQTTIFCEVSLNFLQ